MKFSIDNIKKFVSSNWKYLIGAAAFILLVVILVALSNKENQIDQQKQAEIIEEQQAEQAEKEEQKTENVEPANSMSTEEYPEVNKLVQLYFTSMANNDIETLKGILAEVLPEDEEAVKKGSEYTESYNNIVCYTKPGKEENSYVVFASYEAKFVGINTTAPGLLSFYVLTKEDGSLYIQNKLDDDMKSYIQNIVVEDKEVANLFEASQKRYEQALSDDASLKEFVAGLESGNTNASEENKEQTAENTQETTEQTTENTQEPKEETTENTETNDNNAEQKQDSTALYVKAKENVNVRNAASETADAIGKLQGGEVAEKTGEKDGWIAINYKGQPGYVKADFVEATSDASGSVSKEMTENSSSENKEVVYVKETVNIRESMSQDSKKVGVAYAGDKFTKIMDYAEGWTKIDYNGTQAYIKTEFLETR